MDKRRFLDITSVRIVVEGAAAARAATCATRAEIVEISRREQAFRALGRQGEREARKIAVSVNQAFHFAVYAAASSPELLAIIERLWLQVGPIINLDLRENPERLRLGGAVRYHADLLAAIIARDPERARAALAADIEGAATFILSQQRLPE